MIVALFLANTINAKHTNKQNATKTNQHIIKTSYKVIITIHNSNNSKPTNKGKQYKTKQYN